MVRVRGRPRPLRAVDGAVPIVRRGVPVAGECRYSGDIACHGRRAQRWDPAAVGGRRSAKIPQRVGAPHMRTPVTHASPPAVRRPTAAGRALRPSRWPGPCAADARSCSGSGARSAGAAGGRAGARARAATMGMIDRRVWHVRRTLTVCRDRSGRSRMSAPGQRNQHRAIPLICDPPVVVLPEFGTM